MSVRGGAVFPSRQIPRADPHPSTMKRCQSDELQPQQGEEDGAALDEAAGHLLGADLRPGEATTGANSTGGPTSDAGAVAAPNPGPRSKPPDLKVSTDPCPGKPSQETSFCRNAFPDQSNVGARGHRG